MIYHSELIPGDMEKTAMGIPTGDTNHKKNRRTVLTSSLQNMDVVILYT